MSSCSNCDHSSCFHHLHADICDCHYIEVHSYDELKNVVEEKEGTYFYVGAYDGEDFELYVQETVKCTAYKEHIYYAEHLDECYYWTGSHDLVGDEQNLLDDSYNIKWNLNSLKKARLNPSNNPTSNYLYVRCYKDEHVRKEKK